jgi:hypothetical protein
MTNIIAIADDGSTPFTPAGEVGFAPKDQSVSDGRGGRCPGHSSAATTP